MLKEFMDFLKQYGVVGMAIAVIVGGKLNQLVTSLVNDLLTPVIFSPLLEKAGVANIYELNYKGIMYGKVFGSLVDFLIVAFIIFVFAKYVMKEDKVAKK